MLCPHLVWGVQRRLQHLSPDCSIIIIIIIIMIIIIIVIKQRGDHYLHLSELLRRTNSEGIHSCLQREKKLVTKNMEKLKLQIRKVSQMNECSYCS